ncbi:MAG: SUMF1/EgtB/PvdO family nonheme iron enzyme [Cocleimonas sp.]|nr:SUMF1/EgtB/PvdO family nonheme iron enzyme [Cocleimonas sp.]
MNDKQSLIQELKNTHKKAVDLVSTLSDDELSIPYHPGVNPPLWEVGHVAFFFEVFILKGLDQATSLDPSMDDIWDSFNIDHKDRWKSGMIPSKEKTLHYVDDIYQRILSRIKSNELSQDDLYLYKYAIFHQNMHVESLIWARQTMSYKKMEFVQAKVKDIPLDSDDKMPLGDAKIPAGSYWIGMPAKSDHFATDDFAFDNEKSGFNMELDSFQISKTLVSNQEFLAFVEEGGYEKEAHWSWAGKKWLRTERDDGIPPEKQLNLPKHPLYWKQEKGEWLERHFNEWKPLIADYPVTHVSFFEVEAFCNWAGRRLPTEYEWEAAALGNIKDQSRRKFPWGNHMDANKVDMNGIHLAHTPVTAYPEGDSIFGCRQMLGTVWEWTSSQYLPYPEFTVDMYVFMSTLQFGYHKTTKGGSCATSSVLIRGSYRQAYLPDRTDVFVGFRTCAL